MGAPAFDPSQPFEAVNAGPTSAPAFDPSQPFEAIAESRPAAAPSLLGNEPDDGYVSGALKGAGTAIVKGLSNSLGTIGNLGNFSDYLLARGDSAVTGRPMQDVLADYAKKRDATGLAHTLDPANVLPSGEEVAAPVLKRTGEYKPTSEIGKMAQSGVEAATSMIGPGGGAAAEGALGVDALRTAAKMAPANIAAGAVGQGVTDASGDPLLGMGAGMAAPGLAGAAASRAGKAAASVTRPFAEDLPVIGPKFAGQRDQMVGERLRGAAQDPNAFEHALFPGPRQPDSDEIIPGSKPTTGQLTGDMGILGAERRAVTADNTDFNIRSAEQDAARRAELAKAAPDADVMKPSQFFQDQLDHIERGTNEAIERLQSGAQQLAGRLGPGEAPEALGASIRDPIQSVYDQARKARNALYDAVDPVGTVSVVAKPVRDRVQELTAGLDPYDAPLKPDEARIFGRVKSLPDVMPFKSLNALDKDIYAAMSAERRSAGQTPTWGRLSQLKNAVMDAINNGVDNQTAYEQAAVAAGKLKPQDTIQGRLEGLHGEYGGALGSAPRNTGTTSGENAAVGEAGIFGAGGEKGAGDFGSGNAARVAPVPESVAAVSPQDLTNHQIFYPGGNLRARYEVVDHPDLVISHDQNFNPNPAFPTELQPRARESAPARDQVNGMASRLQPERLGPSPEANSGAPIIGPDNVVESGNGRALAIGQAYRRGNTAYRDWLQSQGFDTAGMKQPVLVARRTSKMTPAEREYFANSANSASGLKMSAAEQAASDAKIVNDKVLGLVADAPVRSAENRDFVRAFADKLPANERGGILDKDGNLSQSGVRRIEAALAAKAFDDTAFVGRAFDSADSNIRNLAGALVDAAGPWARMRAAAQSGAIDGSHDITHELMDVVHKVMRARDEGIPVADVLKQNDMFGSDVKPLVENLLFRDADKGLLASRSRIASGLKTYASEAEKNLAGPSLFGDELKPGDVFKTAIDKATQDSEVSAHPVPTKFRGVSKDDTGPWFLDGDKPIYANATRQSVDKLFGDRAREFDGFGSVHGLNKDGQPIIVWYKPGEKARALREIENFKQKAIAAESDKARLHYESGINLGYPESAVASYVEKRFGKNEVGRSAPTFETGASEPIRTVQPNFDQAAADRLNAAKSSHKDLAQTFRNPTIKPVLKTLGGDRDYALPSSAIPAKAVVKGDKGYQAAKSFLKAGKNDPGMVDAMKDRALAPLRSGLKPDGTLIPAKFAKWKQDYAGALKALDEVDPGFSSRFDNAAKASDLLVEAGAIAKKRLADARKNAAADFMKLSTPVEVENKLGTILQSKTGPSQMADVLKRASGDPEVIDGLRKAGIDWMTRKFAATTESGTSGEKQLAKGSFDKFVRDNATTLSALYPPEQVNMFRAIARDMDRSSRVLATNVKGSPGTAKDSAPLRERAIAASKHHNSILAAASAGLYAGYHFGGLKGALIAGGMEASAYLLGSLRAAGINKVEDMFRDALLNPERARYYLAKVPVEAAKADGGPMHALGRAIRRGMILQPELITNRSITH